MKNSLRSSGVRVAGVLWFAVVALLGCPSGVPDDDDTSVEPEPTPEPLPDSLDVDVVVVRDGVPLEGASVLQGGGDIQAVTGADGLASIVVDTTIEGEIYVVAAMIGHHSAGFEIADTAPDHVAATASATVTP